MDVTQVTNLRNYFNLFFVKAVGDTLQEGWLRQLHRSAGGGDSFLFHAALFSPTSFRELMKYDWNDKLYRNEGVGKDNKYSKTGILLNKSKFDPFKKTLISVRDDSQKQAWNQISNKGEQLYKLIFDTLAKLYKFN